MKKLGMSVTGMDGITYTSTKTVVAVESGAGENLCVVVAKREQICSHNMDLLPLIIADH